MDGYNEVVPGVLEPKMIEVPHKCKKHPRLFKKWWEKNANIPYNQLNKEENHPPCYELPEHLQLLDNCINLSEQILKELNNKNDEEK
jgi:hypothetical protein